MIYAYTLVLERFSLSLRVLGRVFPTFFEGVAGETVPYLRQGCRRDGRAAGSGEQGEEEREGKEKETAVVLKDLCRADQEIYDLAVNLLNEKAAYCGELADAGR